MSLGLLTPCAWMTGTTPAKSLHGCRLFSIWHGPCRAQPSVLSIRAVTACQSSDPALSTETKRSNEGSCSACRLIRPMNIHSYSAQKTRAVLGALQSNNLMDPCFSLPNDDTLLKANQQPLALAPGVEHSAQGVSQLLFCA